MTEFEDTTHDDTRNTTECPNCSGVVIEPRDGGEWLCTRCARHWPPAELPEVAE